MFLYRGNISSLIKEINAVRLTFAIDFPYSEGQQSCANNLSVGEVKPSDNV